jgi:diguanylate cyclase (GGDEF)-like protein
MTLFRQLLVFILVLLVLLFAGTWYALIEGTRTFLSEQLASHSQDTATSFGLSISPHVAKGDIATVETMMNAVFDRGYYKAMKLTDINGKEVVGRSMEIKIEGVPEWFIRFVPLDAPVATSMVMSGWSQAGQVQVESNPGYAYKEFWNIALMMSAWFVAMVFMAAIIGGIGIHYLLKPLHRLEKQAEAITKRRYIIQEKLPRTRELNSVVRAMNDMTVKVRSMFEKQAAIARRLRDDAFMDEATGLGNRRYFEGQIKPRLQGNSKDIKGAVLLLEVADLKEINEQKGREAGDALLQAVTRVLKEATQSYGKSALAHLGGGDFGVFLPKATRADAEHVAKEIVSELPQLAIEDFSLSDNVGHVGCVIYTQATSFNELLSEADNMLRSAQQQGANSWQMTTHSEHSAEAFGESKWKQMLDDVLEHEKIKLFAQSVMSTRNSGQILHKEMFSRVVQDDGQIINAGVFMPLAERLNLVSALDRLVLKKAHLKTVEDIGADTIAINLSANSLRDRDFMRYLLSCLEKRGNDTPRIIFEFLEFSVIQHLDKLTELSKSLGDKYGIALDHFGSSFTNFGYLHSLRPEYVKIDRAFTNDIDPDNGDSDFFVKTLCDVAGSLDIMVIAEGVETEEQFNILKGLGVGGVQGYFIDKPIRMINGQ